MRIGAIASTVLLLAASARADVLLWDEGANGALNPLSNDRFAPTQLALAPGANLVRATSSGEFPDYVTLAVPTGHVLTALVVAEYAFEDGVGDGSSFAAVQAGGVFTVPPDATFDDVPNLLGYTLFGTDDTTDFQTVGLGEDILDDLATGPGARGFTRPLASGAYTYWLQNTRGPTSFGLRFDVVAVPEPATLALGAVPALLALRRR